jgi:hemerythrin
MAVQWTTDLSTRIIEIDDHHKELFRQIDSLINVWERGGSRAEAESIVRFLADYTAFHFAAEEKYMDRFGYSSTRHHKAQHAVFVSAFQRLMNRYFQSGVSRELLTDMNEQIVEWFVNHVKYADKALGLFLKLKLPSAGPDRSSVTPGAGAR